MTKPFYVFSYALLFFLGWYSEGLFVGSKPEKPIHIQEGDTVSVKPELNYAHEYNTGCKRLVVKSLQAADKANLAWVLAEDCDWTNMHIFMVTFEQNSLEKAE